MIKSSPVPSTFFPDHVFSVVLAGGSGTRFWPKSRLKNPKQLCKIGDPEKTMLELTLERLDHLIPPERRILVTHEKQAELSAQIIGKKIGRIIKEPQARNTANALCLAALEIEKMNTSGQPAVMISMHADHVIKDLSGFEKTLRGAVKAAEHDFLTLVGIKPTHPETGFGYIERGLELNHGIDANACHVQSFREKPDLQKAQEFVGSGRFLWNSGLFIWRTRELLNALEKNLPQSLRLLQDIIAKFTSFTKTPPEALAKVYEILPKISIDHAVLEKSQNVAMVEAQFGWLDVGSWDAVEKCVSPDEKGNVSVGEVLFEDSTGCTVDTDGPLIAVLGMHDIVAVHSKNAILICPKNRAQEVKKIVERLERQGAGEYL